MIGSIVLPLHRPEIQGFETPRLQPASGSNQRMDPLSEVLALMKPQVYVAGGFSVLGDVAVRFPKHNGVKCYAMLAGDCWLVVEGVSEPVLLHAGDCFLLPRGLPFHLTTDLSLEPLLYSEACVRQRMRHEAPGVTEDARYIAGGHFALSGGHAEMLLQSLPPIVHIRRESDKTAMRWSLERMREELRDPQPGGSLIAQQLAYMMLIQALRLHLADTASARSGWLSALSDKHMSIAIAAMHNDPGYPWTLQSLAERVGMSRSVFALRFRETVGATPMEYLIRWRMLLAADRLTNSSDGLSSIAQSLGYESESAFGKAFRRVMGCSPRQYTLPATPCAISANHRVED
ncbi:AraC-like DNA-binding protein [Silvibacterium bohemicum]|uniref:AraC-like DNA-binding protein n=1 Tax=Silvibacterium bohemicum TaxID=1577686 RepID=A0A841JSR5_9BACT|nr:AraC family transcriptional regulator [Silvibacterium bohemicum]MBB6143547.1 AraC-like DNA-binding protein [Silvibacterium bohemicum]